MVKNPVLFMTFARPDYAEKSFSAIKAAQPKKLYFYSNKARVDREDEVARNNKVRELINQVDWDCDLHVWKRNEYVDVYTSLLGAKQWAFKNEDTLIMLEEDCFAGKAFFQFCDYFLEKYKDDLRVNFITGNNYAVNFKKSNRDHYVTRSIHHHGWATWKNRWNNIDWNMMPLDIINDGSLKRYYSDDLPQFFYYERMMRALTPFINETHCWDFVKVFNQIKTATFAITPLFNLVQNIGLKGVHEKGGAGFQFGVEALQGDYPFLKNSHSGDLIVDGDYDKAESKAEGHRTSYVRYIASRVKHDLLKL